jgi:predicted metal-dependent HD superfamily phosphohydrolase
VRLHGSRLDRLAKKWATMLNRYFDLSFYRDNPQTTNNRFFQLLVAAYSKPDRHYHNLNHIYHILTILERFTLEIQDPIAVYIAACFHDFVSRWH